MRGEGDRSAVDGEKVEPERAGEIRGCDTVLPVRVHCGQWRHVGGIRGDGADPHSGLQHHARHAVADVHRGPGGPRRGPAQFPPHALQRRATHRAPPAHRLRGRRPPLSQLRPPQKRPLPVPHPVGAPALPLPLPLPPPRRRGLGLQFLPPLALPPRRIPRPPAGQHFSTSSLTFSNTKHEILQFMAPQWHPNPTATCF